MEPSLGIMIPVHEDDLYRYRREIVEWHGGQAWRYVDLDEIEMPRHRDEIVEQRAGSANNTTNTDEGDVTDECEECDEYLSIDPDPTTTPACSDNEDGAESAGRQVDSDSSTDYTIRMNRTDFTGARIYTEFFLSILVVLIVLIYMCMCIPSFIIGGGAEVADNKIENSSNIEQLLNHNTTATNTIYPIDMLPNMYNI